MDVVRVAFDLPREVLSALRQDPDGFARAMRLAAAKWYEDRLISQSRAAETAGLSRAEFLLALGRLGVSPLQYELAEVIREVEPA